MIISILDGHVWTHQEYADRACTIPTLKSWGAERYFRSLPGDIRAHIYDDVPAKHWRVFATERGYIAGEGVISEITINPDGSGKYRFVGVGEMHDSH